MVTAHIDALEHLEYLDQIPFQSPDALETPHTRTALCTHMSVLPMRNKAFFYFPAASIG